MDGHGITVTRKSSVLLDIPVSPSVCRGESVYVHCKAGRGRSTTIVLCYLCMYHGLTPHEAHLFIKKLRPQISARHDAPEVHACYKLGREMLSEAGAGRATGAGMAAAAAVGAGAGQHASAATHRHGKHIE